VNSIVRTTALDPTFTFQALSL